MTARRAADPVEPLLAEMKERADAEAESRLAAARAEADAIRAGGEERRRRRRDEALARCDAEVIAAAQSDVAGATCDARQRVLRARHAFVDRVISRATDELRRRAESGAPADDWLRNRVAELLSYFGDTAAEVSCPVAWVPAVERLVATARNVVVVAAPPGAAIGLCGRDADGRVLVDDTVGGWLRRERPSLAIAICRAIEPEDP